MTDEEYQQAIDFVFEHTDLIGGGSDLTDDDLALIPDEFKVRLTEYCNRAWGEGTTIRPDRLDSYGSLVLYPAEDIFLSRRPNHEDVVLTAFCKYLAVKSGNLLKAELLEEVMIRFYPRWPD